MDSFRISIDFTYGRCKLSLATEEHSFTSSAYQVHRSFKEFVRCIVGLLDGRESTSCRWVTGELAGGVFIDFVIDPDQHINLAAHEFAYDQNARTYATMWSAERGDLVFRARVAVTSFFPAAARALRRARVLYVDPTGYMPHWGSEFPEEEYRYIQDAATRYGYNPTPTDQIQP